MCSEVINAEEKLLERVVNAKKEEINLVMAFEEFLHKILEVEVNFAFPVS